jgi:hypothetical protein
MKKILLCLFLIGCSEGSREEFRKEVFPTAHEEAQRIFYVKDARTNLCFVRNSVLTDVNSVVFTNVPCTPEVEKLIK